MALKAGRVGLAWQDVDAAGHLIDAGGGGVQDVKVDGVSVVTEGVANIVLPEVEVGDVVLKEVSDYKTSDAAILTCTHNDSLSFSVYPFIDTEVTIDGVAKNLLVREASVNNYVAIEAGRKILCTRSYHNTAASGDFDVNVFLGLIGDGVLAEVTVNTSTSEITSIKFIADYQRDSTSASKRGVHLGVGSTTHANYYSIKYYKYEEV